VTSSVTWASVRPIAGSVATSRAGPSLAAAQLHIPPMQLSRRIRRRPPQATDRWAAKHPQQERAAGSNATLANSSPCRKAPARAAPAKTPGFANSAVSRPVAGSRDAARRCRRALCAFRRAAAARQEALRDATALVDVDAHRAARSHPRCTRVAVVGWVEAQVSAGVDLVATGGEHKAKMMTLPHASASHNFTGSIENAYETSTRTPVRSGRWRRSADEDDRSRQDTLLRRVDAGASIRHRAGCACRKRQRERENSERWCRPRAKGPS
jgi:hypothetical protein